MIDKFPTWDFLTSSQMDPAGSSLKWEDWLYLWASTVMKSYYVSTIKMNCNKKERQKNLPIVLEQTRREDIQRDSAKLDSSLIRCQLFCDSKEGLWSLLFVDSIN